MLKIIIGPAGAGQSDTLCREMVESAVAHPSSYFYAVVPEQSTLRMQRAVVEKHPNNAVMNIDVVSFERLAHRVFQELGIDESDILNDTGKVLILRKVLEECRDELSVYKNKVHMPGFASEMKSVVTELKQYAAGDDELSQMLEAAEKDGNVLLYNKLRDVRLIYNRFNRRIEDRYTTQEEILDVFAKAVHRSEIIKGSEIYLDGFTGFTPVQYKLIEELIKYAADITVAFTLPEEEISGNISLMNQFALSNKTYERLCSIAERTFNKVEVVSLPFTGKRASAYVFNASGFTDEVNFAAKEILRRIRHENYRFRDFAVVCCDMEAYYDLIKNTFREAGISCFIDYKTELGDNSLARFVMAAVQLLAENFSYESIFSYLKSGMTDIPLNDINQLENYVLEFGIKRFGFWKKEFRRNRSINGKEFWDLEKINNIRKMVLDSCSDYYSKYKGPGKTAGEYSEGLRELLLKNNIENKMLEMSEKFSLEGDMSRGKEYEQIYSLIFELLNQITDLMGEESLTAQEYSKILSGALDEIKVGIIPPSLDAVIAGDLTRTRFDNIKELFVIGANDGKIPASHASSGVLTQREREFLKKENFELAPTAMENLYSQHFYIYLMASMPSDAIYFTYSSTDGAGTELYPSYIIEDIADIMPGMSVSKVASLPEESWKEQAARELSAGIGRMKENETDERTESLLKYFAANDEYAVRQAVAGRFFTNMPLPLDKQTVLDLYGGKLQGSVSRYEKYYECPFKHFLSYGLRLDKRPEYEVEATDIGNIYHNSLELYSKKLAEEGLTFRNISDERSHELARQCVEEISASMEKDVMTSSQRNIYLLKRMTAVTEKTTDVLRDHVKSGLFEPAYYEYEFRSDIDDHAEFKGKIDRVDIYDGGDIYIKIIDYKSGNKTFSLKDIYTGQQLQLTAYLSAAVKEMKAQYPDRNVKVGGVYYYLIQDKFVPDEEAAKYKFRMSGLTNCEPAVLNAVDRNLGAGASSNIIEAGYKKDGDLTSASKVANENEFAELMKFVDRKIISVSEKINEGDISVAPFYESPVKNACTYCDYKDVCKFEPGKWGSDYRRLPDNIDMKDMEREVYGRCNMD